jgi:uncharacterized protein
VPNNNNYKVSNFSCFYSLNDKLFIIFNTLSRNILKVDKNSFIKLKQMQKNNKFVDNFGDKLFTNLVELGIVVKKDVNEYEKVCNLFDKKRLRSDKLFLTVAPTLDCNFACPYCYEIAEQSYMERKTELQIIDFISRQLDVLKSISVIWIGGEPLLNKQTVLRLSKEIARLAGPKSISVAVSLITNGYLLDKQTVDELYELGIKDIQITIDGDKNTHNKRRYLKSGRQGTFQKIVKNLEYCSKKIENITVRVNIDRTNKHSWSDVKNLLIDLGIYSKVKLNIGMVDAVNEHNLHSINKCLTVSEFSKVKSDFIFDDDNLHERQIKLPAMPVCSAVRINSFSIDANGFLYKCWNHIGFKEKSCGHISQPENLNSDYYSWISFNLDMFDDCRNCTVLPICMGNCPDKLLKFGVGDKVCSYYKNNLKEIVLLYYLSKKQKPCS